MQVQTSKENLKMKISANNLSQARMPESASHLIHQNVSKKELKLSKVTREKNKITIVFYLPLIYLPDHFIRLCENMGQRKT